MVGLMLSKGKMTAGDIVHSHGIEDIKGSLGLVKSSYADVAIVSFPLSNIMNGNFKQSALRKLVPGDTVKYIGTKTEIPHQEFGTVAGLHSTLLVAVHFTVRRPAVGEEVSYAGGDPYIPFDELGRIEGVSPQGNSVRFPNGISYVIPSMELRYEFNIPFVALKYVDVKTALQANRDGGYIPRTAQRQRNSIR